LPTTDYLYLILYRRHDGRIPNIPVFEALEKMKKEDLKEFFHNTAGLLSQGGYSTPGGDSVVPGSNPP
jgi:hypothetical protein